PAGSGKTNICLQALVANARQKRVAFIDTEGGFNDKRLEQIAGGFKERVLKNTILLEPTSFKEQKNTVEGAVRARPALIIADSMTHLYRLELDDDNVTKTNRELSRQLQQLVTYARTANIQVLVTNQVYTNVDTKLVEPVGGDVLRYASKAIVELAKTDVDGVRSATLRKHSFKRENESVKFRIGERGLADAY
ncbi:DNA repair and recombination protein RadB, partial [archaeon]|nr:DNA repair and recombination protein RadB [archaeon]